mgnify:CR=1 FL=1
MWSYYVLPKKKKKICIFIGAQDTPNNLSHFLVFFALPPSPITDMSLNCFQPTGVCCIDVSERMKGQSLGCTKMICSPTQIVDSSGHKSPFFTFTKI